MVIYLIPQAKNAPENQRAGVAGAMPGPTCVAHGVHGVRAGGRSAGASRPAEAKQSHPHARLSAFFFLFLAGIDILASWLHLPPALRG